MTYCKNFNRLCFIVDQIQDTVITDANAMAIVAVQFLDAMRTRVVFQFNELPRDSLANLFGKSVEFLFRRAINDDCVSHAASFGFAGGQILAQRSPRSAATLLDGGDVEQVFAEMPVLQQPLDHRFALILFKTAESGVHGVCRFSNHVGHAQRISLAPLRFNSKSRLLYLSWPSEARLVVFSAPAG